MSTLKDKLANSVRQAKSAALTADQQPRTPGRSRPSPTTPAPAAPRAAELAGTGSTADDQNPASSASEKFPRRVWPD